MKLFYLISLLILFNGCNAQTSQNDSIPKEFEFINTLLPKNLANLSLKEFYKQLETTKNINVDSIYYHRKSIIFINQKTPPNQFNFSGSYEYDKMGDTLKKIKINIEDDYTYCYHSFFNNLNGCGNSDSIKLSDERYLECFEALTSFLKYRYYNQIKKHLTKDTTYIEEKYGKYISKDYNSNKFVEWFIQKPSVISCNSAIDFYDDIAYIRYHNVVYSMESEYDSDNKDCNHSIGLEILNLHTLLLK